MGKRTRSQRKGSSPNQQAPSHRHVGVPSYPEGEHEIKDLIHAPGRNTPLVKLETEEGEKYMIPAEGMITGDEVKIGSGEMQPGNVLPLEEIPEGTPIFNIEARPGDDGAFARSGGSFGVVVSKGDKITVRLPSKKTREFDPECKATIGTPAGAGRKDKPFVKAGAKYYHRKSRGKSFPITSPDSMNAADHPFGGKTSKGRNTTTSHHAPPGSKVGSISPRQTGEEDEK